MGKDFSVLARSPGKCTGKVDLVSERHIGANPGSEIEGWAWDLDGKRPVSRVLLLDQSNRVVGAADAGRLRPDVPKAIKDVTTPAVGWKGVAHLTSGVVTAAAITADNTSCIIGSIDL
jgi:hypothetical protein